MEFYTEPSTDKEKEEAKILYGKKVSGITILQRIQKYLSVHKEPKPKIKTRKFAIDNIEVPKEPVGRTVYQFEVGDLENVEVSLKEAGLSEANIKIVMYLIRLRIKRVQ